MSQYDAQGKLTRAAAESIIRGGGTVMLNGKQYGRVGDLPGEADFAKGDVDAEQAARARLLAHRADIDRQLASIGEGVVEPVNVGDALRKANKDAADHAASERAAEAKKLHAKA